MNDTTELTSEAEWAEIEQLMKLRDEQKREKTIALAELEEMKRLESEVLAKVANVRLELQDRRKEAMIKRVMVEESEKAALASNDAIHNANRLQRINKLTESKERVMQAFGPDKLDRFQRQAMENQKRMDDAPWIPEHNQLVDELRVVTSQVDALKSQVGETEAQVAQYERQLHGHSELHFKDFVFKACELALKEKRSHSALCIEAILNAELKRKIKPRNSDLDTTQEEVPPSQPSQQSLNQLRVDRDLPRESSPSRGAAFDDHDDGMETDDADQHLAQLAGNGRVLQDNDDTLADLDITERDVAYGSSDAARAYQQQQEMDTSLVSEVDEGEIAGNGNKPDDGPQKFVTPATPSATLGVQHRQDESDESTPAKQAFVQPKVASLAMASSQRRNGVPDQRPSSSQSNNQLSPRMGTPLAKRAGTEQEGRWMRIERPQSRSGTPSRPARNSDYDAPPKAHAAVVPSGSTDREPRTPVRTQRPPTSAKPSSKPVEHSPDRSSQAVFRAPPPPKTLLKPKNKEHQAEVEKEPSVTPHKDTPRPPEKKNIQAASTSTNSNVAPAFVDEAGREQDDANGNEFSFGFGDAGNDNNISFFNNSVANDLANISLLSGSADNFVNMLGGGGSSNDGSAGGADGGFAGFDFGFGGSGDANGGIFDFGDGGDASNSSFNMSQQFGDGNANDDGGFNFGF